LKKSSSKTYHFYKPSAIDYFTNEKVFLTMEHL
jgi:hypothetical protein